MLKQYQIETIKILKTMKRKQLIEFAIEEGFYYNSHNSKAKILLDLIQQIIEY